MGGRHGDLRRPPALMRISVTGSRDCYLVRNGGEEPVRVRVTRQGLDCECGEPGCEHVMSLELCGFFEGPGEMMRAA